MRVKKPNIILPVIFLSLTAAIIAVILNDDAFAQTEVGVGVGVETETKIKVGESEEATTESKTKTSAEAEVKSSSEAEMQQKSSEKTSETSSTKSEAEMQIGIKSSYPKITADSQTSLSVQSKQMLYKPGEKIRIEGSIWSNLVTQLGGVRLAEIQIIDSKGAIVGDKTSVSVLADGSFSKEFSLPQNTADGEYTIKTKITADSTILNTLSTGTKAKLESSTKVVVATPKTLLVKVDGHDDFNVKVASNSKISKLVFKENEKKISFEVEGETGTTGVTHVTIPNALLGGQLTVLIDGKVMASDKVIVTSSTTADTTLELNYNHSVHSIEVVGTNAVPEFGTIALVILGAAIMTTIIVGTKTNLMPKI